MHSKQTVTYICESYPSGNCYYYKKEILTLHSWDDLTSLYWSKPRPITRATFKKRENEGYKVKYVVKTCAPAQIFQFPREH